MDALLDAQNTTFDNISCIQTNNDSDYFRKITPIEVYDGYFTILRTQCLKTKILNKSMKTKKIFEEVNSRTKDLEESWFFSLGFYEEGFQFNQMPSKDDVLNGKGKVYFTNQIISEGQFINAKLKRHGQQILPDGSVLKGEFNHDKLIGQENVTRTFGNGKLIWQIP